MICNSYTMGKCELVDQLIYHALNKNSIFGMDKLGTSIVGSYWV